MKHYLIVFAMFIGVQVVVAGIAGAWAVFDADSAPSFTGLLAASTLWLVLDFTLEAHRKR